MRVQCSNPRVGQDRALHVRPRMRERSCPTQVMVITLQATTLPAIPLQATTLPATPLQAITLPMIPLQATTLPAIPLQATTLPAIPLQATTLQAHPMSPGPSSSRVSPAQVHPFPKAITQGKRRKNARKSDILSGSPYRKLVTDKVEAQSATGKKRSWKKILSIRDQYRAGPLTTSGIRRIKPVSCSTSDDICNCQMCGEDYSDPPTEDWVQCDECKAWWHEKCPDYGSVGPFLCDNCTP